MNNKNDTDTAPARVLYLKNIEVPRRKQETDEFIQAHNLKHGDVINFGDFRFADAKIVRFNENDRIFELIDSIDVTDAGYLEIPLEVTRQIKSALRKYHNIIKEIGHINLMLPPTDEFIQLALGILSDDTKILLIIDNGYIGMALIYRDDDPNSEQAANLKVLNEIARDNNLL